MALAMALAVVLAEDLAMSLAAGLASKKSVAMLVQRPATTSDLSFKFKEGLGSPREREILISVFDGVYTGCPAIH